MMRMSWLAGIAALAIEGAAIACSCMATDDPVELRKLAADAVQGAVALVEAEALTAFDPASGGERVVVRQVLAGNAPKEFQIERGPLASGASCDNLFEVGQRRVVILYPVANAARTDAAYQVSSMCTDLLLDKPVFRDAVARQIGRPPRGPERG